MKITYDKEADAMYIYFQNGRKIAKTVELSNVLIADLDRRGKVIGVEVLCASEQIPRIRGTKTSPNFFETVVPVPTR